jgi:hypothetical protein
MVASLLLVVVAWHSAPSSAEGVRWGIIAALFAGLVPMAYIVGQVRRQRLSDRHLGVREQRRLPLLVGIVSALVGIGCSCWARRPASWWRWWRRWQSGWPPRSW